MRTTQMATREVIAPYEGKIQIASHLCKLRKVCHGGLGGTVHKLTALSRLGKQICRGRWLKLAIQIDHKCLYTHAMTVCLSFSPLFR